MKITIDVSKKDANHLVNHVFSDECDVACKILYKVRAELRKVKA